MNLLEQIIDTSLKIPGVKVDRNKFLTDQFKLYYSKEVIQVALESNPTLAGIPHVAIKRIAKSTIKNHVRVSTTASFVTGLPGGITMLGAIPVDMAQFYSSVIILAQKLAYLYGWPDLSENDDSEVFKEMISMFLGVMFGVVQANKMMSEVSRRLAAEIVKRLPKKSLTKYAWYNLLKKLAKWLGIKLTKDTLAKAVARVVPILSGILSGGFTYFTMKKMASRLEVQLASGALFNPESVSDDVNPNDIIIIEDFNESKEIEVVDEFDESDVIITFDDEI